MSFKPIDIQINISQMNNVAKHQQHERTQPLHDQAAHAAHLKKEGDERRHIVEPKGQTTNEESTVKWRKEGGRNSGQGRGKENEPGTRRREIQDIPGGMRILECDSDEKGNIIDTVK